MCCSSLRHVLIACERVHETQVVSGNNNNAQNLKNYFAKIDNTKGEQFSERYAFEDYMKSANLSEALKCSLDTIVGLLKSLSPGHDEILISSQKN